MAEEICWLALCVSLALGEALGFAASRISPAWPIACALAATAGLLGYAIRWRGWRETAAFGAGFALALASAAARDAVLDNIQVLHCGRPYEAVVAVEDQVDVRAGPDGILWASFAGELGSVRLRIVCPCPVSAVPQAGELWRCCGWLAREPSGVGGRYAFWVRGRGTFARREGAGGNGLVALRRRVKSGLSARLGLGLERTSAAANLHRAILLGEKARLERALKAEFVAAGTIHVFAISGLHVMVIARLLAVLLALVRLPSRVAGIVLIPAVWAYAYLTGMSPSAIRASTMITLCYLAPMFWRRPNGIVAWALTFLAVYAVSPWRIFDVGCWMSFMVMLALVLWGRWGARVQSGFVRLVLFTAAAWLASLPIAAHVFGRITPGGLLSNLLVAPLAAGSVVGSVAGALGSWLSPTVGAIANNLAAVSTELMVGISQAVAALPGANVEVPPWPLWACLAWYAGLVSALFLYHRWSCQWSRVLR